MTVFNAETYLCAAVESILGQDFADFEFIAVDDGSTDGTLAILERFAARDARMRVMSLPHQGSPGAANAGIASARGEYLARMDGDDVSLPSRLRRQVTYLDQHPEFVAVGCLALNIDPDGCPLYEEPLPLSHEEIDGRHLQGRGGGIMHPALMVRCSALRSVGGYDERYQVSNDYDLLLRLAEVGCLANLPEVLLMYRRHPRSISQSRTGEQNRATRAILQAALKRRGLPPPSEWLTLKAEPMADLLEQWMWRARYSGYLRTARKYALRLFRAEPLSRRGLGALARAAVIYASELRSSPASKMKQEGVLQLLCF